MRRMTSLLFPPRPSGRFGVVLLLLRVVAGAAFMFHGWPKIQNPLGWMGDISSMPSPLQALAALSEFGGGLAWLLVMNSCLPARDRSSSRESVKLSQEGLMGRRESR